MLVCYDFHLGISSEEDDLMFVIELGLLSIKTIDSIHKVKLEQHVIWFHQQV